MDTLAKLPPTVLVVLAVLLAVWLILLLLVLSLSMKGSPVAIREYSVAAGSCTCGSA